MPTAAQTTEIKITKERLLILRELKLKHEINRAQRRFSYRSDLIAQQTVVHNELAELRNNKRREVSRV